MAKNLEDYDPDQNIDQQYIQSYGEDFSVHKLMLSDKPRMDFYHDAIKRVLSSTTTNNNNNHHKFVIDCGAGSGILSMLALKYGARKVYSIEASDRIAQTILPNIKRNMKSLGFFSAPEIKKRFSLHQGMAESFPVEDVVEEIWKISSSSSTTSSSSPVRQDDEPNNNEESSSSSKKNNIITIYLVSEWMGFYLLHEAMLQSVLFLRDKIRAEIEKKYNSNNNTKETRKIQLKLIPDVAEIYCAPFDLRKHYVSSIRPTWQFLDFDFSFLGEVDAAEIFSTERNPVVQVIHPNSIVVANSSNDDNNDGENSSDNNNQRLITLDLSRVTIEELEEITFSASFSFHKNFAKTNPTTTINGFAIWFSCFFVDLDDDDDDETTTEKNLIQFDGVKKYFSSKKKKVYDELSTSPFDVATHWKQTVVMISDEGIPAESVAGDTMKAVFTWQRDQRSYLIGLELE